MPTFLLNRLRACLQTVFARETIRENGTEQLQSVELIWQVLSHDMCTCKFEGNAISGTQTMLPSHASL